MDVRFSAEQRALRDSVVQVVDHLGPRTVAQLDDRERAAKLDAAVAAAGWRELRTAADDGAPWSTAVEAGIVAEELARGLADVSFLGPSLAADLRRLAGAPASVAPDTVAFASDLGGPTRGDDGPVAVDTAGIATALVIVPAAGGYTLAAVDIPDGGGGVDLTRPTVPVAASMARPTPVATDATIDDEDLTRWTALGLALTCADLVGVMRGATELTVTYASEREQFGTPVGSFQAVQHLLADAAVHTEGSRTAALHAAWAADALPPADALAAAAEAKAYCARAARAVCEIAIQVHGGIGNTWECMAHVFLRRAVLSTDLFGGIGTNLARVLEHHGIGHLGDGGADGLR
jgi:alkylation response protein AidB-like acyl-CoA dehydrogenase